jgi:hypothetical protein
MNVREEGGNIRTDNIALDVAGVGTATGAGTVSAAGALAYNVVLKLTGLSVGGGGTQQASSSGGAAGAIGALSGFIPGGAGGGAAGSAIGVIAGAALKNGIPVAIGGTTSNPTFSPNVAGLAGAVGAGAAQSLIGGKGQKKGTSAADPLSNALGGLLGKH